MDNTIFIFPAILFGGLVTGALYGLSKMESRSPSFTPSLESKTVQSNKRPMYNPPTTSSFISIPPPRETLTPWANDPMSDWRRREIERIQTKQYDEENPLPSAPPLPMQSGVENDKKNTKKSLNNSTKPNAQPTKSILKTKGKSKGNAQPAANNSKQGNVPSTNNAKEGNAQPAANNSKQGNVPSTNNAKEGNAQPAANNSKKGNVPSTNNTKQGNVPSTNNTKQGNVPSTNNTKQGNVPSTNNAKQGNVPSTNNTKKGNVPSTNNTKKGNANNAKQSPSPLAPKPYISDTEMNNCYKLLRKNDIWSDDLEKLKTNFKEFLRKNHSDKTGGDDEVVKEVNHCKTIIENDYDGFMNHIKTSKVQSQYESNANNEKSTNSKQTATQSKKNATPKSNTVTVKDEISLFSIDPNIPGKWTYFLSYGHLSPRDYQNALGVGRDIVAYACTLYDWRLIFCGEDKIRKCSTANIFPALDYKVDCIVIAVKDITDQDMETIQQLNEYKINYENKVLIRSGPKNINDKQNVEQYGNIVIKNVPQGSPIHFSQPVHAYIKDMKNPENQSYRMDNEESKSLTYLRLVLYVYMLSQILVKHNSAKVNTKSTTYKILKWKKGAGFFEGATNVQNIQFSEEVDKVRLTYSLPGIKSPVIYTSKYLPKIIKISNA
jgi:hypothetical protein